mgnify:FL=1
MSRKFLDRFNEEGIHDRFWSFNKQIGVVLGVLFLAIIMINTTGCTQGNSGDSPDDITNIEVNQQPQETVKVGNDGVNAAIAPDDVSIVADQATKNSTMVAMSVEDMGRSDPFLPEAEKGKQVVRKKPAYSSYLMPPPETITVDTMATDVMTTKVSGIMYDKFNPSAILNISGSDYLVRSGDVINGYKVLSIGRETVTVQYGSNVYKASVGELFTGEGLNFNTISNLNSKFGGSHNKR